MRQNVIWSLPRRTEQWRNFQAKALQGCFHKASKCTPIEQEASIVHQMWGPRYTSISTLGPHDTLSESRARDCYIHSSVYMARVFDVGEVARHRLKEDLYLVIRGQVCDVTKFQYDHP